MSKEEKAKKPEVSVTTSNEIIHTTTRYLHNFDYVVGDLENPLAGVMVEIIYDDIEKRYPEMGRSKELVSFKVDGKTSSHFTNMQHDIQLKLRDYLKAPEWTPDAIDNIAVKIGQQIRHWLMKTGVDYAGRD